MRHFAQLEPSTADDLFQIAPAVLGAAADPLEIGGWLGATLYVPGWRADVPADLARQRASGVGSVVVDFEDSAPERDADGGPQRVATIAAALDRVEGDLPLAFLRMRSAADIERAASAVTDGWDRIAGFVFAKYDPRGGGPQYLDALERASDAAGRQLLGMPIVEAPVFAYGETRLPALLELRQQLAERPAGIACVRIGGTDIASAFGLRRSPDITVYDLRAVADVISDVVNVLSRRDGGFPISGAVWEHYGTRERLLKPQLRETPFTRHDASSLRAAFVRTGLDALLSEIHLDGLNGLSGKTVIHPRHVPLVHALAVVSAEDHADALSILSGRADGGIVPSPAGNKMNEVRPHLAWAERVLARSRAFGVARPEVDFVDFLVATQDF